MGDTVPSQHRHVRARTHTHIRVHTHAHILGVLSIKTDSCQCPEAAGARGHLPSPWESGHALWQSVPQSCPWARLGLWSQRQATVTWQHFPCPRSLWQVAGHLVAMSWVSFLG